MMCPTGASARDSATAAAAAFAPSPLPLGAPRVAASAGATCDRSPVGLRPAQCLPAARVPPAFASRAAAPPAPTMSSAPPAPLRVIINGAPASGKGTQCALIVAAYGLVHLSTGDMLRAAVAAGSDLGVAAKTFMDAGALVPDSLVIDLVIDRVRKGDCADRGWLLDGFPRTEAQALALDSAGVVPNAVVCLDVEDAMLVERVVGRRLDPESGSIYHVQFNPPPEGEVADRCVQRSDDTEEKARSRLATFHQNSAAIENHYKRFVRHVDGSRSKESVFEDVGAILGEAQGNRDGNKVAADAAGI